MAHDGTSALVGARRLILATSADNLPDEFRETGFYPCSAEATLRTLQEAGLWIGPQDALEQQPAYRQIIPYVILRVRDRFVRYTRSVTGSEKRLHGRMSIGLGGHVELSDVLAAGSGIDLAGTLEKAAQRELNEELGNIDCLLRDWIGVLVDNRNAVGRVHIGVVGLWTVRSTPCGAAEDAINNIALCSIEELQLMRDRLEGWSEMLLPHLQISKQ